MTNIIKKSEELTDLLKELDTSVTAEKHRYVVKLEYEIGKDSVYSVKDNITGKVILDKLDRIKSWLHLRNVDEADIFYI
jgi:hypothetical protein